MLLTLSLSFADELFSQFVVIGGCESLIRDLERVAEEFLTILYPSEDFKVSGKPKFTFSLDEVKIDGSFQYNRETCGVNKNIFNKVIYFNFFVHSVLCHNINFLHLFTRRCQIPN